MHGIDLNNIAAGLVSNFDLFLPQTVVQHYLVTGLCMNFQLFFFSCMIIIKDDLVATPGFSTTGGLYEDGTDTTDSDFDVVPNAVDISEMPELFLDLKITED